MKDLEDFIQSLTQVADSSMRLLNGLGLKDRAVSISVFPSGANVSCYDVGNGRYDFWWERLECCRTWSDETDHMNQLRVGIDPENTIPFYDPFDPLDVEDDGK